MDVWKVDKTMDFPAIRWKNFLSGNYTGMWNTILSDELGYKFPAVLTGGSVTSDAFMIADYIGFRKIILVGQDMAFTNGISHTSGIEGAFGDNDEYIDSRYQVYVEGIDGQKLKTDFQMWRYKKWFEKLLRKMKAGLESLMRRRVGLS